MPPFIRTLTAAPATAPLSGDPGPRPRGLCGALVGSWGPGWGHQEAWSGRQKRLSCSGSEGPSEGGGDGAQRRPCHTSEPRVRGLQPAASSAERESRSGQPLPRAAARTKPRAAWTCVEYDSGDSGRSCSREGGAPGVRLAHLQITITRAGRSVF